MDALLDGRYADWVRAHETGVITLASAVVMLVAWYWCICIFPPADDVLNFYKNAECIKDGMLPYVDFTFEFPPFALVFFMIPSLFTSDVNTYAVLFALMIAVFVVLTQYFLMRICERVKISRILVAVLFLVLTLIYFSEAVKKFDTIVMFTTVLALWFVVSGRRKSAYTMLAVGAFIKMYPALFIPLLMIFDIVENRRKGAVDALYGVLCCLGVAALAFVPLMIAGVPLSDSLSFITFHADRGFHVESFVAVLIEFASLFGITEFELVPIHYTFDIDNPLCDILQPVWLQVCLAVFIIVFAGIVYSMYRRGTGADELGRFRMMVVCFGIVTVVFLLTNKVFSTQYMIWLIPIAALLCVTGERNVSGASTLVFLLAQVFTYFITKYDSGTENFIVSNMLRDSVLIIALAMMLVYMLYRRGPLAGPGVRV